MTKQELIKILDEKIENAENHRERIYKEMQKDEIKEQHYDCVYQKIQGNIDAYTDIKNLLENEVLENETRSK